MNAILSPSSFRTLTCLCLALLAAGCATKRVDWNARVGNYTYQQAVLDMGPPDRQAKLEDGTTVAEWLRNRGYTYFTGGAGGYYPYGSYYASPGTAITTPSLFTRLTFGSDGRLIAWKKVYR